MARIVDRVVDVMLSREGLQNATITLDTINEADMMARARTREEITNLES